MKNLTTITIVALLLFSGALSAQNTVAEPYKQNELKVNLSSSIFLSFPEISYDRVISSDLTLGALMGVRVSDDNFNASFAFIPRARWFFAGSSQSMRKYASGFFIELNGGVFSSDVLEINPSSEYFSTIEKSVFDIGLGAGAGWKYISTGNWVGEISLATTRGFTNETYMPVFSISVGKRF